MITLWTPASIRRMRQLRLVLFFSLVLLLQLEASGNSISHSWAQLFVFCAPQSCKFKEVYNLVVCRLLKVLQAIWQCRSFLKFPLILRLIETQDGRAEKWTQNVYTVNAHPIHIFNSLPIAESFCISFFSFLFFLQWQNILVIFRTGFSETNHTCTCWLGYTHKQIVIKTINNNYVEP